MADNYQVSFWRPNRKGEGAGAIFSLNENGQAWLRIMPQNGEKSFDNNAAINVKLGQADIGALLSVVTGQSEGIGTKNDKGYWSGLLHTFKETTTAVGLALGQNNPGYYLNVSRKEGDGQPVRMGLGVSFGDGQLLRVFLERAAWASMYDTFRANAPAEGGEAEGGAAEAPAQAAPKQAPAKTSKVAKVSKVTKTPVAAGVSSDAAPAEDIPF